MEIGLSLFAFPLYHGLVLCVLWLFGYAVMINPQNGNMIDCVIIANSHDDKLTRITQQAIDTAIFNEQRVKVNVIVVESQPTVNHKNCVTLHPTETFGYNKFLNIGAREGLNEYICFANNDLLFKRNWASTLIDAMADYACESAAPVCPVSHPKFGIRPNTHQVIRGLGLGEEGRMNFPGWCFTFSRRLWSMIGGLDELCTFWCSENLVVEQLKKFHQSHLLVTDSVVEHLRGGSTTLNPLKKHDPSRHSELTELDVKKFNTKYNYNLFGWGKLTEADKIRFGI